MIHTRMLTAFMALSISISPWVCGQAFAASKPSATPLVRTGISQNDTNIELTLGKAQVIKLASAASRVSISNPDTVSVVLISPTEVELIGKAVGVANLLIWTEQSGSSYTTVDLSVHRDVSTLARKIRMIDPGINILPVAAEDSVILTGVAESQDKAQLAYDLAKAFFASDSAAQATNTETTSNSPGSASFAETSTKIINLIRVIGQPATKAEMVQERLKDIDPSIELNVVPGFGGKEKAILHGRVKNTSAVARAVNLASVFYGTPGLKIIAGPAGNSVKESDDSSSQSSGSSSFEAGSGASLVGNFAQNVLHGSIITDTSGNVVSMLEVNERPQIKCSIKFLEIRKSKDKLLESIPFFQNGDVSAIGYSGSNSAATPSALLARLTGAAASQVGINFGNEFSTLLNGMITDGKARILAEPTLTSISGEPASFLAGGEFPIPVLGGNGSVNVVFKQFGIQLNLQATVTERGTIHMQVSPEVSSLDPSSGVTLSGMVIPGIRSRRSQTVLEMKDGDNFVLGGLYNEDMTDTIRKVPLLGQLPIIGKLFQSRDFQRDETEMLIVIHPEIQTQMNLTQIEKNSNAPANPAHVSQVIPIQTEEMKALASQTRLIQPQPVVVTPVATSQTVPVVQATTTAQSGGSTSQDLTVQVPASEIPSAQAEVKAGLSANTQAAWQQWQQVLQLYAQPPAPIPQDEEPQYQSPKPVSATPQDLNVPIRPTLVPGQAIGLQVPLPPLPSAQVPVQVASNTSSSVKGGNKPNPIQVSPSVKKFAPAAVALKQWQRQFSQLISANLL